MDDNLTQELIQETKSVLSELLIYYLRQNVEIESIPDGSTDLLVSGHDIRSALHLLQKIVELE